MYSFISSDYIDFWFVLLSLFCELHIIEWQDIFYRDFEWIEKLESPFCLKQPILKVKTIIMNKNNKAVGKRIKLMFIGLMLVGSFTASAQIVLPGDGEVIDNDAPIDGFLSIGLIAGAVIGLRKRYKGLKD